MGSYFSFTKKDAIKNVDVWRDKKVKPDIETEYGFMKNKIPSGCTTHIY